MPRGSSTKFLIFCNFSFQKKNRKSKEVPWKVMQFDSSKIFKHLQKVGGGAISQNISILEDLIQFVVSELQLVTKFWKKNRSV